MERLLILNFYAILLRIESLLSRVCLFQSKADRIAASDHDYYRGLVLTGLRHLEHGVYLYSAEDPWCLKAAEVSAQMLKQLGILLCYVSTMQICILLLIFNGHMSIAN